jgi:hypothetical protein
MPVNSRAALGGVLSREGEHRSGDSDERDHREDPAAALMLLTRPLLLAFFALRELPA